MKPAVTVAVSFLLFWTVGARARPIDTPEVYTASPKDVERRLPESHPVTYLGYAARMWGEAKREDAVFWLYVGQLRFRFHLAAHPELEQDDDPALFGAMMSSIGEPINTYAGRDPVRMQQQIDRVLAYDAKTPNGFTSKTRFKAEWQQTRSGLRELQRYFATHVAEMRQAREQNGIGEIGMISPDGPYMEIRNAKMPADWPALLGRTDLALLTGHYAPDDYGNVSRLFFSPPHQAMFADEVDFLSSAPNQLTVRALRKGQEVGQVTVDVTQSSDAVVLTRTKRGESAGLSEGEEIERVSFRINDTHELVVQREIITDGIPKPPRHASGGEEITPLPSKKVRHHSEFTFWKRAQRLPDPPPDRAEPRR